MGGNEVASSTENTTIVCGEDGPHYSGEKLFIPCFLNEKKYDFQVENFL